MGAVNPSVVIRKARTTDAEILSALAQSAKRHWGYPEEWLREWANSLRITASQIEQNKIFVAIAVDRPIGFFMLVASSDRLRLEHLWVTPEWIGRGVGRMLFDYAVQTARALGHCGFEIESDPNAEGFYLRMGARRISILKSTVAGHNRETPLLRYDVPTLP